MCRGGSPFGPTKSPSGVGLGGRRKQSSLAFPGAREIGGMTNPHDGLIAAVGTEAGSTPACGLARDGLSLA